MKKSAVLLVIFVLSFVLVGVKASPKVFACDPSDGPCDEYDFRPSL